MQEDMDSCTVTDYLPEVRYKRLEFGVNRNDSQGETGHQRGCRKDSMERLYAVMMHLRKVYKYIGEDLQKQAFTGNN